MKFGTALFDLDGTLTNPEIGIVRCMLHALEKVGITDVPQEVLRGRIGLPLQDAFLQLGVDQGDIDDAMGAYRERFVEIGMYENEVISGIPELLESLTDDGWLLGIATSKPEEFATEILRHFELLPYFKFVSGATLDGSRRHKADVIRYALDQLGVDPQSVVMIGDRREDAQGAKQHEVRTIAVSWGFGSLDEFEDQSVLAIAETAIQLLEIMKKHAVLPMLR